jgi:hypothetical protein
VTTNDAAHNTQGGSSRNVAGSVVVANQKQNGGDDVEE